ncbi:GNAT family N-acetyltransferase [Pedobacter sp. MC2016-15]|uniref:GNAT family N-acetyltransferase n=1 Tax=Pedobacter sp. MC2016-15 TaxID=2994473 RepID=UPI0022450400|nr:GNAT family N-acetyltransferase [Pedobacter sp. MC2016-15]MCX2479340.1 GNAT family N-acetyltransferase [Pedobacter sp. MC2016-15]
MITAKHSDRDAVVEILMSSFVNNKSITSLVGTEKGSEKRLKSLMNYAFAECMDTGMVYLSEDFKACALVIFPEKKNGNLMSLFRDLKLIFSVIGISNISKILKKESIIKKVQNAEKPRFYLWFLGVDERFQGKGIGTDLLRQLLDESSKLDRELLLETSTERNLPFYVANGLRLYADVDVGYKLYFFKSIVK